jgi:FkbM family methyltransferase
MFSVYKRMLARINLKRGIPLAVTELYLEVKKYLPERPVILEAGAHMGFDTYGLARIWPKAEIHAFEPVPNVYNDLVERLKECKNVKMYNLALGSENGTTEMHVSSGGSTASSSILKPSAHLTLFPSVTFENKIVVPLKRLDHWAKDQNLSIIDMIWLDMQGYEVYALKGSGALLKNVSVIYTELCKSELYSGLVTQDDYIKFLGSVGFELISISGDEEVKEGVFVNKKAIAGRNHSKARDADKYLQ